MDSIPFSDSITIESGKRNESKINIPVEASAVGIDCQPTWSILHQGSKANMQEYSARKTHPNGGTTLSHHGECCPWQ